MAQQTINVGTTVNDGTGDTLRAAFVKTVGNFSELYTTASTLTTNLGTTNTNVTNLTNSLSNTDTNVSTLTTNLGTTNTNVTNLTNTVTENTTQQVLDKTTSYTGVNGDNRRFITFDSASATTYTVPSTAAVGWECAVMQLGIGQTTIAVGGTGALRHSDNHTKTAKQYAIVYLKVYSNSGTAPQVAFTGETAT